MNSGKLSEAEISPTLDEIPKRGDARLANAGSRPAKIAQTAAKDPHPERPGQPALTVVLIESRSLLRECWIAALKEVAGCETAAFATVEEWRERSASVAASVILLCVATPSPRALQPQLALLDAARSQVPIVVLGDDEDSHSVAKCIDLGVRGYIPTSATVRVAVQALRLVAAGGMFVPASCTLNAVRSPRPIGKGAVLSARQMAVVESLRRGKSNKEIASELKLRETTVKVHVRNIMRKLKARNRTEVAFMLDQGGRHANDTGAV